ARYWVFLAFLSSKKLLYY
ncbi:hypothetical protein EE612_023906, partial [Oryza sativa]